MKHEPTHVEISIPEHPGDIPSMAAAICRLLGTIYPDSTWRYSLAASRPTLIGWWKGHGITAFAEVARRGVEQEPCILVFPAPLSRRDVYRIGVILFAKEIEAEARSGADGMRVALAPAAKEARAAVTNLQEGGLEYEWPADDEPEGGIFVRVGPYLGVLS